MLASSHLVASTSVALLDDVTRHILLATTSSGATSGGRTPQSESCASGRALQEEPRENPRRNVLTLGVLVRTPLADAQLQRRARLRARRFVALNKTLKYVYVTFVDFIFMSLVARQSFCASPAMSTKSESKSTHVKGLALHPTQRLLAATLHNGSIQLWNVLIDRCEEYGEPFWAVNSHPSRALLASGGKDKSNCTKKCPGLSLAPLTRPCAFGASVETRPTKAPVLETSDRSTRSPLSSTSSKGTTVASTMPCSTLSLSSFRPPTTARLERYQGLRGQLVPRSLQHCLDGRVPLKHELIVSCGEDKTVRVWDLAKGTTFRRENDRFWILASHATLNLSAAGDDPGLIVFKLERERPAFTLHQESLSYIRDKYVRSYDFNTGADFGLLSVRKCRTRCPHHRPVGQWLVQAHRPATTSAG
uniref:Coatomer subunit alpha-2 n=1 Tax=Mycena chlorophos TaxID=658473 RepID=A0ABQ0L3X2_MYCCL|nr:coatomer subunit alpha-2 [Mycena chlorophos]